MKIIIVTFSWVFVANKLVGAYTVECPIISVYTIHAVFDISRQH